MKLQTFLDSNNLYFAFSVTTDITLTENSRNVDSIEVRGHVVSKGRRVAFKYPSVEQPIVVTHATVGDVVAVTSLKEIVCWISGCLERSSNASLEDRPEIYLMNKDGTDSGERITLEPHLDCTGFVENHNYQAYLSQAVRG